MIEIEVRDHYLWDIKYSLWWRENAVGYTDDLQQAGRFTKNDGFDYGENDRRVVALLCSDVDKLPAKQVVNMDALQQLIPPR